MIAVLEAKELVFFVKRVTIGAKSSEVKKDGI